MRITRSIEETRSAVGSARAAGKVVGFVPTMGFLHEGHLSLIDAARDAGADFVIVSIFVNPTQFGPNDDFTRYPRDEARDRELLEKRGVDVLFLPEVEVMYPPGSSTKVRVADVAGPLEGERRPGHFDGVATIVTKLFNIVQPGLAAFGRKDAQQCAVVSRLVRDLDIPVRLVFGETMREHDGLAMSSRNTYLSPAERKIAPALHRALRAGEEAILHGIDRADAIEALMAKMAAETPEMTPDYFAVADPVTFERPERLSGDVLLLGAVRIGKTRLIDNIVVHAKIER